MTSAELYDLFRKKWDETDKSTEFAYEVRNAAGFDAGRSCDALSIGTWPSRGLLVDGYEFKVSRADWLRELKEPAKAEAFYHFCDRWWLVAGDASIVADGELPNGWGLIIPSENRKKLTIKVQATKNETQKPWSKSFRAAVIKRFAERGLDVVSKERSRIRQEVEKEFEDRLKRSDETEKRVRERLESRIENFERTTGISMDHWRFRENPGLVKRALALVDRGELGLEGELRKFRDLAKEAERLHADLVKRIGQIEQLFATPSTNAGEEE